MQTLTRGYRVFSSILLALVVVMTAIQAHAVMVAAGTKIINQAKISYFDTQYAEIRHIYSNFATITVARLVEARLDSGYTQHVAAGESTNFPHLITNTGNIATGYKLELFEQNDDDGDYVQLTPFFDPNGNGVVDAGEKPLAPCDSGATYCFKVPKLAAGDVLGFVVQASVNVSADIAENYSMQARVVPNEQPSTLNASSTTVIQPDGVFAALGEHNIAVIGDPSKAILSLNKRMFPSCSTPITSGDYVKTYLSTKNAGHGAPVAGTFSINQSPQTGVIIEDNLLPNIELVSKADIQANASLQPMLPSSDAVFVVQRESEVNQWIAFDDWDETGKLKKVGFFMPATYLEGIGNNKEFTYSSIVVAQRTTTKRYSDKARLLPSTAIGTVESAAATCLSLKPPSNLPLDPSTGLPWADHNDARIRFKIPAYEVVSAGKVPVHAQDSDFQNAPFYYHTDSKGVNYDVKKHGVFLELASSNSNLKPTEVDKVTVELKSSVSGERVAVKLAETGKNTGIFRSIRLIRLSETERGGTICPEHNASNNVDYEAKACTLKVETNGSIFAQFTDSKVGLLKDTIAINPQGIVFNALNNQPVAGAVVVLRHENGSVAINPGEYADSPQEDAPYEPFTTGADGTFQFPVLKPGKYYFDVQAPEGFEFPSTRVTTSLKYDVELASFGLSGGQHLNLELAAANGESNLIEVSSNPADLNYQTLRKLDIPLDPDTAGMLVLDKRAATPKIGVGNILKYEVDIYNRSDVDLYATKLDDVLPYGFRYLEGSARLNDEPINDPEGGVGPNLKFSVGLVDGVVSPEGYGFIDGKKHTLSYFVRATAGAVDSDGINIIKAAGRSETGFKEVESNPSRATVEISQDGVLLNDGIVIGRVYAPASCSDDESTPDLPIGNVKLYLEDGSWVRSDAKGFFSLYGVSLGEHVLKVDSTTLPKGMKLVSSEQRHFFDGDSRWIDLKAGELHRADFTLDCKIDDVKKLVEDIRTRNEAISETKHLDRLANNTKKTTDALRSISKDGDLSSGTEYEESSSDKKDGSSQIVLVGYSLQLGAEATTEAAEKELAFLQKKIKRPIYIYEDEALKTIRTGFALEAAHLEPLQKMLRQTFGFSSTVVRSALPKVPVVVASALGDNDMLSVVPDPEEAIKKVTRAQGKKGTWLWPKTKLTSDGRFIFVTRKGLSPKLVVNGQPVSKDHLGIQIENQREKAQILAWYGVDLQVGENTVEVVAKDPFGNVRKLAKTTIVRPDKAVRVVMKPSSEAFYADDGESILPIKLRVEDSQGHLVDSVYFATLKASEGTWVQPDIQDKVSGHQVRIDGGERLVHLRSSTKAGEVDLSIEIDQMSTTSNVSQIKPLRPLIAVGLVNIGARYTTQDSNGQAPTGNAKGVADVNELEGRTAFFVKGRVWKDKHLTLSYDSNKNKDDKLFRDIDPSNYYPVYGDASTRGYEAQSRSKLYVKLEQEGNSAMWGDFRTDSSKGNHEDLAKVQRTLTGANAVYDDGKTRIQAFAAEVEETHEFEEIRGNGTALNYRLNKYPIVKNSERIELVTYDRNNLGLELNKVSLARLENYILDDVSGFITFHDAIPSVDDDNNPVYIRVNYDVDEGQGEDHLVAGLRATTQLNDELTVGASFTRDENPDDGFDLMGAFATYEVSAKTKIKAGIASMKHQDATKEDGQAARISAEYEWNKDAQSKVTWGRADEGFTNNGAGIAGGREELSASHKQKLNKDLSLTVEATNSKALDTKDETTSVGATANYKFEDWRLKGGARYIEKNDEDGITTAILGAEKPVDVFGKKGRLKAEVEQDTSDAERQRLKLGGEVNLSDNARFYANYEHSNSLSLSAGDSDNKSDTFTMGVKGKLTDNIDAYTEYRLRGSLDDRETEAVNGVRAKYEVSPGFSVTPSVEVVRVLEGGGDSDSVAISVGIEDRRNKNVRKHARIEARDSDKNTYMGFSGSYVGRLDENWTGILREELRVDNPSNNDEQKIKHELTVGLARRSVTDSKHDMLLLYKNKENRGPNTGDDESVHILTLHQNYEITDDIRMSTRLGGKIQRVDVGEQTYKTDAALADMRVIWDMNDRVAFDVHGGVLGTDKFSERQYSAGVGVSYLLRRNLRLGMDYNLRGFDDKDLDEQGYNSRGPSIKLQYKFDEKDLDWLFK